MQGMSPPRGGVEPTVPAVRLWSWPYLLMTIARLLPFKRGLPRKITVRAWRVPKQSGQRFEVARIRRKPAFEIPLEHHAHVERRPRGSVLLHLPLEGVHVFPCVTDLLAEKLRPDHCHLGAAQHIGSIEVVDLPLVALGRK